MDEPGTTRQRYLDFADQVHGESPCMEAWSRGAADDLEVLASIDTLPEAKRQPNLVIAAARWHGLAPGPYAGLRSVLLTEWPAVEATVLERATQTNEVGRCATLLPVLAGLTGPLALLEVGASAGLCLYPDRYSYRYSDGTSLDPADGPSRVVLPCEVSGDPPLPEALPEVVWRAGVDLNPLDVTDADQMRWLQTLVWPEHDDRRARLSAAVDLVRQDPPRLVRGDLTCDLADLAAQAPAEATLVVFHSAVIAYLSEEDRERFAATVRGLPGHWVSNEGPRVLPGVAATATGPAPPGSPFLTAFDGQAVAWSHPHGRSLTWL